jgi:hypothetical protein
MGIFCTKPDDSSDNTTHTASRNSVQSIQNSTFAGEEKSSREQSTMNFYTNIFARPPEHLIPTISLQRSVQLYQEGLLRNTFNQWKDGIDSPPRPFCLHELVELWKLEQCKSCGEKLGEDRRMKEETFGTIAETQDQSIAIKPHSVYLHGLGVSITWLLAFTFDHNCWEKTTKEVVRDIVQPATRDRNRCRYSELKEMKPYVGNATIFMSHCWGAKWKDLVLAACLHARKDRIVWIDIFAVRQWPGNTADINSLIFGSTFRGVIKLCTAVVVSSSIVSELANWEDDDIATAVRHDFLTNSNNKEIKTSIFALRLWCIVEIAAGISFHKPIVVKCGNAERIEGSDRWTYGGQEDRTGEAPPMMANLRWMVDTRSAECAVAADKLRELAYIEKYVEGGVNTVDAHVSAVLSGAVDRYGGRGRDIVDTYMCGETDYMRSGCVNWDEIVHQADRPEESVCVATAVFQVAACGGRTMFMRELLEETWQNIQPQERDWIQNVVRESTALWEACAQGHEDVVELLFDGEWVEIIESDDFADELMVACEAKHINVVTMLLKKGVDPNGRDEDGSTALIVASIDGNVEVVKVLLAMGADASMEDQEGYTALEWVSQQLEKLEENSKEASGENTVENKNNLLVVRNLLSSN